mgnify:CR=1 FL=1|tara:strand:+ start:5953 stop:6222 length:270 start_codon:yes stop_codon:yes gene_type:complete
MEFSETTNTAFATEIDIAISKVEASLSESNAKLEEMEKDFADVKLNPYGITSIDFQQRQELLEDSTKMEGVIMGLQLAKDTYAATFSTT